MSKIWFTSDTHFGHTNIIKFCKRPFNNVDDMDATIIKNWNRLINPKDTVYHLGDFCFRSKGPEFYRKQLNGNIHLIWGNHDRRSQYNQFFYEKTSQITIKIDNISITLNHFSMRVWPKSHFNSFHLYGHSHGTLPSIGKSLDVGVDSHNFKPWSWDEIKNTINDLPHNFNWVKALDGYNQLEFEEEKKKYDIQKI